MKLDTSRQYGTILGIYLENRKARFTQDGKLYDANGDLIYADGQKGKDVGSQKDDGRQHDVGRHDDGRHGHEQADGQQADAQAGNEKDHDDARENEEGHVLTMDKTDVELEELASKGIAPLREYSKAFDVNGLSKSDIISGLKALRK